MFYVIPEKYVKMCQIWSWLLLHVRNVCIRFHKTLSL